MAPDHMKLINIALEGIINQTRLTNFFSMIVTRALARILKLLVIFERVPVQNGLKWFKMG